MSVFAFPRGRVDRCLLGFTLALGGVIVLVRPAGWPAAAALHAAVAAAILGIAAGARRHDGRVPRFLQRWYPLGCFLLFFEEVGPLARMLRPEWCDRYLIGFDFALFGLHPTVWMERIARPWLTELMQGCYFSYYLLAPGIGALLALRKRWIELERMMAALAFGYVTCYAVYYLFPVEGPYHTLHNARGLAVDGFFSRVMDAIERAGRVHGGAFPSAHVVGTVIPWLAAFDHALPLGCVLAPLVTGVLVATVYGRYHYVADVLAGVAVACGAYAAAASGTGRSRLI